MFEDCDCGLNCPMCEDCGMPECECDCGKDIDEPDEDFEW